MRVFSSPFPDLTPVLRRCPTQARFWLEWGLSSGVVWPHALGIETISGIRAQPLRHILLLSSAAVAYVRPHQANFRARAGACAAQFRTPCLRLCGHARACSLAGQRARARCARRCSQVAEARRVTPPGRGCPIQARCWLEWGLSPAFPAKALLRFQRPELSPVCRETPLHPPESSEAWIM